MSCPYAGGQSAARRAATLAAQLATPPAGWSHPSLSLSPTTAAGSAPASYKDELLACRVRGRAGVLCLERRMLTHSPTSPTLSPYRTQKELWSLLDSISCNPILVRLAWHDSGTFDRTVASWPECGGANGSIRFADELGHGANAGLCVRANVGAVAPEHA